MDASGPNSPQVTEIKRDKIHSWTVVDGGAAGTLSAKRFRRAPGNRGSFVFPDSARRISWANAVS